MDPQPVRRFAHRSISSAVNSGLKNVRPVRVPTAPRSEASSHRAAA
jgi:hypothetical protein